MKQLYSSAVKPCFLYLYNIVLHASLTLLLIHLVGGIDQATRGGNQFIIDGSVKLYWGILFGPVFLFLAVPSLIKNLKSLAKLALLDRCFLFYLLVDLVSFVLGLLLKNDIRFLLSDTFLFAIIPLSYFFVKENLDSWEHLNLLFYILLFSQLFVIAFPVGWGYPSSLPGSRSIGFSALFGAESFVVIALFVLAITNRRRLIFTLLLALSVEASLIRQRTTFFVQILSILPVILFLVFNNKELLKRYFLTLGVTFLIIFSLNSTSDFSQSVAFNRTLFLSKTIIHNAVIVLKRAEQTFENKFSSLYFKRKHIAPARQDKEPIINEKSISQRNFEIKAVVKILKNNPKMILFGFGNGATVDFSKSPDSTILHVYGKRVDRVHNIHFLVLAIIFRQGLFGFFAFLLLGWAIIKFILMNKPCSKTLDERGIIFEVLALNFIAMVIASLYNSPHLFTSLNVGFGFGMMAVMRHLSSEKRPDIEKETRG